MGGGDEMDTFEGAGDWVVTDMSGADAVLSILWAPAPDDDSGEIGAWGS